MYSCREASRIMSDAMERKLTMKERVHLRIHLAVCDMCRNFKQNIHLLERTLRGIGSNEAVYAPLSEQDRQAIRMGLAIRLGK